MENLSKRTGRVFSPAATPKTEPSQGRLQGFGPVAVIDIGSNSVRLVAYERLSRALTPLYNEKVLCGLGRGLAKTGVLSDEAVGLALSTLGRFRHLVDQINVRSLKVIATAAAREASNGEAFIANAERVLSAPLTILSGHEEARAAALGVQSGFYQPDGVVGDLGGGSLELVEINKASVGDGVTLKLGVIRTDEEADHDPRRAYHIAKERIESSPVSQKLKGRTLYLVGGTWRNLAKLHMAVTKYPLSVMHGYAVDAKEFAEFCEAVARGKFADNSAMRSVSRSRKSNLPIGASILQALHDTGQPGSIVLSALGVREGLLYDELDAAEKARDPLIDAAFELAQLRSRSPQHAKELAQWTGKAFKALDVDETPTEDRLRRAASLLADIGWRAHPDYRGIQSHNIIAHAAFSGVDHAGRLYLAMASFYRHQGLSTDGLNGEFKTIMPARLAERARLLGALFRVAYALTGSMAGILPETRLERVSEHRLSLILPSHLSGLQGERLSKRMNALAKLAGAQDAVISVR